MLRTLTVLLALLAGLVVAAPAQALPIDDYADYQPQTRCRPAAKPGTTMFARWVVRRHGGASGGIARPCSVGGTSEHKEGRAFDWSVDAGRRADRRRVRAFLDRVLATDRRGNEHALARRMGIMYVIWNDHIWSSYDGFRRRDYLHAGCRSLRGCSTTLRHRDHVHVSLSRRGGRGLTSWYVARTAR